MQTVDATHALRAGGDCESRFSARRGVWAALERSGGGHFRSHPLKEKGLQPMDVLALGRLDASRARALADGLRPATGEAERAMFGDIVALFSES